MYPHLCSFGVCAGDSVYMYLMLIGILNIRLLLQIAVWCKGVQRLSDLN